MASRALIALAMKIIDNQTFCNAHAPTDARAMRLLDYLDVFAETGEAPKCAKCATPNPEPRS